MNEMHYDLFWHCFKISCKTQISSPIHSQYLYLLRHILSKRPNSRERRLAKRRKAQRRVIRNL